MGGLDFSVDARCEILCKFFRATLRGKSNFLSRNAFVQSQRKAVISHVLGVDSRFGACIGVRGAVKSDGYIVDFEMASVPASVQFDGLGKIISIYMSLPQYKNARLSELLSRLSHLSFTAIISDDGKVVGMEQPDAVLSVGSSFKIEILSSYLKALDHGTLRKSDLYEIVASDRRPPTGIMSDWPISTPVTLDTLALLMCSLSDNTATDILIKLLGINNVSPIASIIEEGKPISQELRWRRSARQLHDVMQEIAFNPYLEVNRGPMLDLKASRINFKGGMIENEISLVGAALLPDGRRRCAAMISSCTERCSIERISEYFLNLFVAA